MTDVNGLPALAGDIGLIVQVLHCVELLEWRLLSQTSHGIRCSMGSAELELYKLLCESEAGQSTPVELCKALDLTGLWAALQKEADPMAIQDPSKNSLIHTALLASGPLKAKKVMLAWLLSRPKAATAAMMRNCRGQSALHVCARQNSTMFIRKILQLPDIAVDAKDNYEATPLIDAVREEFPAVVKVLLASHADPNTFVPNCHGHGDTPLILAVRLKNIAIVKQLLENPKIDLHQKSMDGCPFGKEALEFAPATGKLHDLLTEAASMAEQYDEDTSNLTNQTVHVGTTVDAKTPWAVATSATQDEKADGVKSRVEISLADQSS